MRVEDLDFAKLRAFQLVATHGTLSAAAAQLGLTIPAISAKLKRLDEVIGVPLFKRLPNGLALTPAGERFLRDLGPLIHDTELAIERAHAASQESSDETGSISVAIGNDYSRFFMPRIRDVLNELPRVDLSLRVARRSDSLKALQEGRADFCLGVFPRLPTGVAAKVVARTTMTLVTRTGDEPMKSARLLVAPRGSALRSLLRRSTFAAEWQNVLECPTCDAALDLARLGAAPALVHTICAPRDEAGLQTQDLGEKQGLMQLVVAYRRGARRTRAQQAFFDLLTV